MEQNKIIEINKYRKLVIWEGWSGITIDHLSYEKNTSEFKEIGSYEINLSNVPLEILMIQVEEAINFTTKIIESKPPVNHLILFRNPNDTELSKTLIDSAEYDPDNKQFEFVYLEHDEVRNAGWSIKYFDFSEIDTLPDMLIQLNNFQTQLNNLLTGEYVNEQWEIRSESDYDNYIEDFYFD